MKKLFLTIISSVLLVSVALTGCGSPNYEKKLIGSWYVEGWDYYAEFTLYSDGTCTVRNSTYIGKWGVVNEDQLKITDCYDESTVYTIVDFKDGCLTLTYKDYDPVKLYNTEQ